MSKRILVVDDDEKVRFTLKSSLKKLGNDYEIVTAQDGHEALALLQKQPCDLVITDLRMPGMDGLELTQAIRGLGAHTLVIWSTAYGSAETEAAAQHLNVHRFLHKPLDIFEIRQIAREALEAVQLKADQTPPPLPPDDLQEYLARLRDEMGAYSVFVITTGGQIVDAVGTTDGLEVGTLSALVAGNFLAAHEIARLLGQASTFKLSYHESDTHSVYAYGMQNDYLLVIVFGPETKAGIVWYYARRAVDDLKTILTDAAAKIHVGVVLDTEFQSSLQHGLDDLFGSLDDNSAAISSP